MLLTFILLFTLWRSSYGIVAELEGSCTSMASRLSVQQT